MWMAANGRIMAELICSASQQDIMDYVAYTVKIGEMACRFTWASVLTFDNEYRSIQAAAGFQWRADTPYPSTVSLWEKAMTGPQRHHNSGSSGNGPAMTHQRRWPGGLPTVESWQLHLWIIIGLSSDCQIRKLLPMVKTLYMKSDWKIDNLGP